MKRSSSGSLHFNYYHTGITRQQARHQAGRLLGHPYAKNSTTIYGELGSRQDDALRNAGLLLAQNYPPDLVNDNLWTDVPLLV